MGVSSAKENILKKVRKALTTSTPLPFPLSEGNSSPYQLPAEEAELQFAEEFIRLQGKFVYCFDQAELLVQLSTIINGNGWTKIFCAEPALKEVLKSAGADQHITSDLAGCEVSITSCEALVARTGTIVLTSASENGRTASVYAPVHVCIAYRSQLVYDVRDALLMIKEKYAGKLPSLISFASGPSRTADIEKTLVVGVHGPKEVYVLLVESSPA